MFVEVSGKKRLAALLVVFVGGAIYFGLPFYRAMHYRMASERVVLAHGGTPTSDALLALGAELKKLAPASGIDPAALTVIVRLRRLGLAEAPTYRVEASLVHGNYDDLVVAKVENECVDREFLATLHAGGVELAGMPEELALVAEEN